MKRIKSFWRPVRTAVKAAAGALARLQADSWDIELTQPTVLIPRLPAAWEGVRIALITDLHAGRFVSLEYVRKVVETSNAASPDLIAVAGDLISQAAAVRPPLADALRRLDANDGKFAVLGNHDYSVNSTKVRSLLAEAGIRELTNTSCILQRHGQGLCIAGADDIWHRPAPLGRILNGVPESVPRILLCHNPDYAARVPERPRVDLILCGHTHGGQIKPPLLPPPVVPVRHRKYTAGLQVGPACQVYTSRGLGVVSLPLRFNCRPELPVILLRQG